MAHGQGGKSQLLCENLERTAREAVAKFGDTCVESLRVVFEQFKCVSNRFGEERMDRAFATRLNSTFANIETGEATVSATALRGVVTLVVLVAVSVFW